MKSRKFSIVKTIDIDRIFNEIDNYINQNSYGYLPYLFMSRETADAIEHEVEKCSPTYDASLPNNRSKDGIYGKFTGYKIFINNDLKFGEVEIR